jgi:hypothetical protein
MKFRTVAALVAGALSLWFNAAEAQNYTCPTRSPGDNEMLCASTQFVQQAISGGGAGTFSPGQVLGNGTTSTAAPTPTQVSPVIDQSIGSTRGSILERGASGWGIVAPGTSGLPWVSNGTGADPAYQALTNAGHANMAAGTIKGNNTGGAAPPIDLTGLQAEGVLQILQSGTGAVQRSLDSWIKVSPIHSSDFVAAGTNNVQNVTTNVSITSGTSALTVISSIFASTDCQGGAGCTGALGNKAITIAGAGTAGAPLVTTITSFTSATQVGLGNNAGTTLAAASEIVQWGTDNTSALQNWLNACSGTLATCYFDSGSYLISSQLNSGPVQLAGAGRNNSVIFEANPANTGLSITTTNFTQSRLSNFGMYQLFTPSGTPQHISLTGSGVQQYGTILEDLYLFGGYGAVAASQVQYLNIDRNIWSNQTQQGMFFNYTLSCATGIGKIENSWIAPLSGGNGLVFSSEGGFTVINNDITTQGNQTGTGIVFNSGSACAGGDIYIDNNNLENWQNGILFLKGSETAGGSSHITANDFFNNQSAVILGDANSNWQIDTSLVGNQFYCNAGGTCVTITNSNRNISVVGNTFTGSSGTPVGLNITGNAATGVASGNTFAGTFSANVSNASPAFYAESLVNAHVKSVGVAPTISTTNCPSAAIASGSTDQEGKATLTNAATSCTVTFAQSYTTAPFCLAQVNTGNAAGITTTTTTFNLSFAAGPTQFFWWCRGN